MTDREPFIEAREEFISQWGAIGNHWGISRTMAQVHALLMVASRPLSTDDVMEELAISRGNAHSNLKELLSWGLIRTVLLKGDRKEYFEGEKDVWKVCQIILRERKRREFDPALGVLKSCAEQTAKLRSTEAKAFHHQMTELGEFVQSCSGLMDQIANTNRGKFFGWALKNLKK